ELHRPPEDAASPVHALRPPLGGAEPRGADRRGDAGADREDADLHGAGPLREGGRRVEPARGGGAGPGHQELQELPPRFVVAGFVVAGSVRAEQLGGGLRKARHREAPRYERGAASPRRLRASRVPAARRLSFSKATQRGTGKKPQSGAAESRSTGMYFAHS